MPVWMYAFIAASQGDCTLVQRNNIHNQIWGVCHHQGQVSWKQMNTTGGACETGKSPVLVLSLSENWVLYCFNSTSKINLICCAGCILFLSDSWTDCLRNLPLSVQCIKMGSMNFLSCAAKESAAEFRYVQFDRKSQYICYVENIVISGHLEACRSF